MADRGWQCRRQQRWWRRTGHRHDLIINHSFINLLYSRMRNLIVRQRRLTDTISNTPPLKTYSTGPMGPWSFGEREWINSPDAASRLAQRDGPAGFPKSQPLVSLTNASPRSSLPLAALWFLSGPWPTRAARSARPAMPPLGTRTRCARPSCAATWPPSSRSL